MLPNERLLLKIKLPLLLLQSVVYLHNLLGERLMSFPLDIGSIVGFSGRKKDSEVCKESNVSG